MRARAVAVVGLLGTLGCSAAPHELAWTIEFESTALHDQTQAVTARILRGSCTGAVVYQANVHVGDAMVMRPPQLAPGTYAFSAAAFDGTCSLVADDCQSVTLPGATTVTNFLRAATAPPACAASECHDGTCDVDAGASDAGSDDGATNDAGMCASIETSCSNGRDDDCDGRTDCADSDCAGNAACARCAGVTCGDCQTCDPATGTCGAATDGDTCTGGRCLAGACCTGCVQAGACVTGDAMDACGTGGLACASCNECTSCAAGACTALSGRTACNGNTGQCTRGACCTGCIDPSGGCNPSSAAACGTGGIDCQVCSSCQTCGATGCSAVTDGMSCTGGSCVGGACCTGCVLGSACQPGNVAAACGSSAHVCDVCGECQTCSGGACTTTSTSDGSACNGGMGTCHAGVCCIGCMAGGACQAGTSQAQCGFAGATCTGCGAALTCSAMGTCNGAGNGCANAIDVTGMGDITLPIDTCQYGDSVTINGCGTMGTPDIVISSMQGGSGVHLTVPTGWTIGFLDPAGTCTSQAGACGPTYGASGSTGDARWYFVVERTAGGCGRVNVELMAH